ncbi:MAG: hypothetical protein ACI8RD_001000, partial [Bacillariaceae sp.]
RVPASICSKFPSIVVITDSTDATLLLLLFFGFFFPGLVVVHPSTSVCCLLLLRVVVENLFNIETRRFFDGFSLRLKLEIEPVEQLSMMLSSLSKCHPAWTVLNMITIVDTSKEGRRSSFYVEST